MGHEKDCLPRSSALRGLFAAGLLLLASGCGLPTWSELIGAKKEDTQPLVVPQVVPVQPTKPVEPPPLPPPPNPAEVIAEFQAKRSYELDDAALGALLALPSGLEDVKVLNLNGSKVGNFGIRNLANLTHLTKLDLRNSQVDENAAASIGRVTSLEELHVEGAKFSDQGVAALRPLTNLRVLEINQVRLSPQGWAEMLNHPELEELRVRSSNLNDESMLILSKCPKLRRLQLNDVAITDLGLAQLGRLDVLEVLDVSGCGVRGVGFRGVGGNRGGFQALEHLSMQRCPLNELGAIAISSMKQLRQLNLADMPSMQDIHLIKMVKPLKELNYLQLNNNAGLTGTALTAVEGSESIETLILGSTGVDDRGLARLLKCPNLKRLDLNNTRCSVNAALALKAKLPDLQIDGMDTGTTEAP
jgi:Leucine-rich repeat (LRR) protein